ncbi:MAG TPA: hypothetical protein VGQ17_01180 [Gemmatimonadales bacterium]|jgi:hypothetical protein|nr:hypothetical protein [Gemmatimonadales bacterium]
MTAGRDADPLGLVAGALAFGVTLGVGLLALVTWVVRALQAGGFAATDPHRGLTPGLLPLLIAGTLGAMLAAGRATWTLLAPIANPWRRAMLGIIAGAASFVVALVTWPVDRAFGRSGLLALAALAALLCLALGRRFAAQRSER